MRVTNLSTFYMIQKQIQAGSKRLMDAQEKVATQQRINRMSDNPIDAGKLLSVRDAIGQTEQFQRNVQNALDLTKGYDSSLQGAIDTISRAKELMLAQASNLSTSPQTREAARVEMVSLLQQMVTAANTTSLGGRYIYAGFADNDPTFRGAYTTTTADPANTGGATATGEAVVDPVQFTGDAYRIEFTGAATFDVYDVTRGAYVSQGNAYTSGQEIRFDGISITLTDGATGPAAGDRFNVASAEAGQYAGDDGEVKLELAQGKRLTTNLTGDAVFQGVGVQDGVDVFSLLNRAIDALRDNNGTEMQSLLDGFDKALNQMSNFRAVVGTRQNQFQTIDSRLADVKTALQTTQSDLRDVDIADAMSDLSQQELAYEASLGAASRVIMPTLLDYLK
ncbi:MAG: flagellin [Candidatus Sumerlaeota bacterium]|nr:flagellin [Candidatus Sumerlaeota bacterium]